MFYFSFLRNCNVPPRYSQRNVRWIAEFRTSTKMIKKKNRIYPKNDQLNSRLRRNLSTQTLAHETMLVRQGTMVLSQFNRKRKCQNSKKPTPSAYTPCYSYHGIAIFVAFHRQ